MRKYNPIAANNIYGQ